MSTITTAKAKQEFAKVVRRASKNKERIVLTSNGRKMAAVVPIEDLDLIRELEDKQDLEEARKALSDPQRIPYEQARRGLGLA